MRTAASKYANQSNSIMVIGCVISECVVTDSKHLISGVPKIQGKSAKSGNLDFFSAESEKNWKSHENI